MTSITAERGGMWSAVQAADLIELLNWSCERWPNQPVLIFEDGVTLTRRDLRERVESFAAYLGGLVEPGDRVAISMDNRAEFLAAFLAVVARRAAAVPLNPASGASDALHVLRSSGAVVAVVDDTGAPLIDRANLPKLKAVIPLVGPEPDGLPSTEAALSRAHAGCESGDIVAVTFTSGTTGLPKGCMIDHVWALRATDLALRIHPYTAQDHIFYPVKFFYMDAALALFRALGCGGAFVAARRFSVSRFWKVIRGCDVTIVSTIASMPTFLLKGAPNADERRHQVRFAIQAQIVPELHERMNSRWGFPWLENYGMTEAGLIARVPLELADELCGTGSAGPPAPEVAVRIADEKGDALPTGDPGEILVKQPGMFRGYLGLPDATAELMHDGWIRTGDLGVVDSNGFVSVVGRKKDVIRRSGENVSCREVESVLTLHEGILDAAVVGVRDFERGEEVKAFILLADGVTAADLPPDEIVHFCETRLAPHKVPRYIQYVAEFSRTPSMRVRKELLRGEHDGDAWDREVNSDANRRTS
jgi:crotonobetaine/carnitine-CoA ligase